MKHTIPVIALALLLASSGAVYALDIVVNSNGVITISDNRVLGERSDSNVSATVKPEPQQTINPQEKKIIEVEAKQKQIEVTVREKKEAAKKAAEEKKKTIETKRLNMELPAAVDKAKVVKEKAQLTEQEKEGKKKYLETMLEEKQQRVEEKIQLRNSVDAEGQNRLELESRNVRAKLRGAQFSYDPETNQVTLTTPSGNQKVLTHLPDVALERMQKLSSAPISDSPEELEVGVNENGSVIYKTTATKTKKLLGLFKREVKQEVVLDDTSGNITETEVQPPSLMDKVLNTLSI